MAVYAANSNGDWWELAGDSEIFTIDTKDGDIEEKMVAQDIEEGGDKFEQFIQENGRNVIKDIKIELQLCEKALQEYVDQEKEEDYGDAMTSMDRREYEGRTEALSWVLSMFEPWDGGNG
jgi:hypothetical protein